MHKKKRAPLGPWPPHHYLSKPGGGGGVGVAYKDRARPTPPSSGGGGGGVKREPKDPPPQASCLMPSIASAAMCEFPAAGPNPPPPLAATIGHASALPWVVHPGTRRSEVGMERSMTITGRTVFVLGIHTGCACDMRRARKEGMRSGPSIASSRVGKSRKGTKDWGTEHVQRGGGNSDREFFAREKFAPGLFRTVA